MARHIRELLGTTAIYSAGTLLTQFVSFLLLPLYTRYLTPTDYGVLSLVVVVQSLLTLLSDVSVSSGVFRFYHSFDSEAERRRLLATGFGSVLCTGGTLLLLVQLLADPIADAAFDFADGGPLLRIAATSSFAMALGTMLQRVLQLHRRPLLYVATTFSQFLITVSVTVWLVVGARYGVRGVLYGQLAGVSATAVAALIALGPSLRAGMDGVKWRQLMSFSLPLVPTSLAAMVIAASDRFFLERLSTLHEVGMYSVADKMAQVLQVLVVVPFSMSFNELAFRHQGDPDLPKTFARTFRLYAVGMATMVVLFTLVIRNLLSLATTPEFVPAWVVVPLLAAAPMAQGFSMLLYVGIHLTGRTRYIPVIFLVGMSTNLLLNWLLIPSMGMLGAAIATAISVAANVALTLRVSRRAYPVDYPVGAALRAVGAAAVVLSVYVAFESDAWVPSIALRLGCLAGFALLLRALGVVHPREVVELARKVRAMVSRRRAAGKE